MIPKILHLCWLSGEPFPPEIQKCLDSWKEKLPDYTVMLWDLSKVDVNICNWTRQAYEKKKYAFVSDYVRFYALYNYGGIYLDSDVEVLKSFDEFLENDFFFGFEYSGTPEAAVVGAIKGLPWIKNCLDWYLKNDYLDNKGRERIIISPIILKYFFESTMKVKLFDTGMIQKVNGGTICPYDFFSATNWYNGQKLISESTYSVHHYVTAWLYKNIKVKTKKAVHLFMIKVLGRKNYLKVMDNIQNIIHKPKLNLKGF